MPINKVVKEVKQNLKNEDKKEFNEIETINIKIDNKNEIFSSYDYDSNELLNDEFSSYLIEKATLISPKSKLRVKIFSETNLEEKEVKYAYNNKFKKEFEDYDRKLKENARFAFIMLLIGILFIGFLILEEYFLNELVLSIILEIAAWVFVWEAVDAFFLQRAELRRMRFQMARLLSADFEIVVIKK